MLDWENIKFHAKNSSTNLYFQIKHIVSQPVTQLHKQSNFPKVINLNKGLFYLYAHLLNHPKEESAKDVIYKEK